MRVPIKNRSGGRFDNDRLVRDYRPLFPHLPERTRLFRLLAGHQDWSQRLHFQARLAFLMVMYNVLVHGTG